MTFLYHGTELEYVDHPYNTTRQNERAVELAVAFKWLSQQGFHPGLVYRRHPERDGLEPSAGFHQELVAPLARDQSYHDGAGLEVGNVLGHYGIDGHRVVDLHEKADGVENLDVFEITGSYDWIVSISTIEHVWYDDEPRDDGAALGAICHLRSLLNPGGRMLVTIPGGYHPVLDDQLHHLDTTRACTLVRDGDDWVQTDVPTFLSYGPNAARSVWIGEW